jgi:hypothetical protein
MYFIQHCFICRPWDSTVPDDAGFEPGLLQRLQWQSYALTTQLILEEICGVDRSCEYINRSQTHECGNWGWGRAIPRKGIYKRNCRCSVDLIHTRLNLIPTRLDFIPSRLDLIPIRVDLIHIRLNLIHYRLDLIHSRLNLIPPPLG